ncbi:hypothetical protein AB0M39_40590 [Streptomyces sp. NPDC051907]|uniref:hypothetical protein n=1 Tax=Streptomyces sp. NPDC051907 TaxID=3155284 RepID=UPI003420EADE
MQSNVKIGVAVVGGYFLGRTRKAKMAISLGMFLAGRKLDFDPRQVGKLLANSPLLGSLNDQVRRELVDATKSAAASALAQRATNLADSLQQRTLELGQKDDPEGQDEPADEADEEDGPPEAADEESGKRRRPARSKASGSTSGAKEKAAPSKRAAAARSRSAAGETKKRATPARRSGTPRKSTASTARKSRGEGNG